MTGKEVINSQGSARPRLNGGADGSAHTRQSVRQEKTAAADSAGRGHVCSEGEPAQSLVAQASVNSSNGPYSIWDDDGFSGVDGGRGGGATGKGTYSEGIGVGALGKKTVGSWVRSTEEDHEVGQGHW